MNRSRLGNSDLMISRVGLGTAAMGGPEWSDSWGAQDDRESAGAIARAVEGGINWLDTAPVYGHGHSEAVIGNALRSLPPADRPMVFTKCGMQWDPSQPQQPHVRTLRPETMRLELEDSLRRLQLDEIDLYQIHQPPAVDSASLEDCWGEMIKLQEEGLVRAIGVCNFTVALLEQCAQVRAPDSLQPPFSMLHSEMAAEELPWCRTHGTGVIVYRPLQSGLLTTTFTEATISNLPGDDWRLRHADFQQPALGRHLAVRDGLGSVALRHQATVEEVAIAWALAWPGVTGAIVGARSAAQVDKWLGAGDLILANEDLDELVEALDALPTERGPAHPG